MWYARLVLNMLLAAFWIAFSSLTNINLYRSHYWCGTHRRCEGNQLETIRKAVYCLDLHIGCRRKSFNLMFPVSDNAPLFNCTLLVSLCSLYRVSIDFFLADIANKIIVYFLSFKIHRGAWNNKMLYWTLVVVCTCFAALVLVLVLCFRMVTFPSFNFCLVAGSLYCCRLLPGLSLYLCIYFVTIDVFCVNLRHRPWS